MPSSTVWGWPEWMGVALGLALAAFYRADFAPGAGAIGTISNFLEWKWATVAVAGALWGLLLAAGHLPAVAFRLTWIDLAIVGLAAWALLSLVWTPDLAAAALSGLFAAIALALYLLARLTGLEALLRIVLTASGFMLIASLVSHVLFGAAVDLGFGNENFSAETLVLACCALSLAWHRSPSPARTILLAAGALALVYLLVLAPSNLQYAALGAALAYGALRALPLRLGLALAAAAAVTAIAGAATWIAGDGFADQFARLPQGLRERPQIWLNTAAGITDAPVMGHGWGSFYHSYAGYIDRYLGMTAKLGPPAFDSFNRAGGAAHNELLEIWFVLGLPGLLSAAAIIGLALTTTLRAPGAAVAGWAGLGLVAWLAMAMIEFPGQNAASAIPALLLLALVVPASAAPAGLAALRQPRAAAGVIAAAALALAAPALQEVQAQNRFAAAELLHQTSQPGLAAEAFGDALAASDRSPKLRARYYTESIVAGPAYWNQTGVAELERRYAIARSAAPDHPVLLDLRLKFLLPLTEPPAAEVEAALAMLKITSGLTNANAHVLDAAWALRLGDRERARTSLRLAEERLAAHPAAVSAETNAANIALLKGQLATARR